MQVLLWWVFLLAAVMLHTHCIRPTLNYPRGASGIGSACIHATITRHESHAQPPLFSMFLLPLPRLFLSGFPDMVSGMDRIPATHAPQGRWCSSRPAGCREPASIPR